MHSFLLLWFRTQTNAISIHGNEQEEIQRKGKKKTYIFLLIGPATFSEEENYIHHLTQKYPFLNN
jgi:hypothetical protein